MRRAGPGTKVSVPSGIFGPTTIRWFRIEEETMRVNPYHSTNLSDPDVHHVHNDCPNGQQIPAANRSQGTGGYPLCGSCRRM